MSGSSTDFDGIHGAVSEAHSSLKAALKICAAIESEHSDPSEIADVLNILNEAKQEIEKASLAIRRGMLPVVGCAVS